MLSNKRHTASSKCAEQVFCSTELRLEGETSSLVPHQGQHKIKAIAPNRGAICLYKIKYSAAMYLALDMRKQQTHFPVN